MSMTRRLERLEGRIRPAPGPEDDERAREELNRRLDRLRERLVVERDLYEDDDGTLCLPDGTRLADLPQAPTVPEMLAAPRLRRFASVVVWAASTRC